MIETRIQWADDTYNAWRGCEHVHEGCENCYAESMAKVNRRILGQWGSQEAGGVRVVAPLDYKKSLYRIRDLARSDGRRRRVFVNSLADVFEDWQGPMTNVDGSMAMIDRQFDMLGSRRMTMDDVRAELLYKVTELREWLDFVFVTKRPENARRMTEDFGFLSNVILLTSVSLQSHAAAMLDNLVKSRAWFGSLGVSLEPLLGPVDLTPWLPQLDWVIIGGESCFIPERARPMHPDWVDKVIADCRNADVPVFFKQVGQWAHAGCKCFGTKDGIVVRGIKSDGTFWEDDMPKDENADLLTVVLMKNKKDAGDLHNGQRFNDPPRFRTSSGLHVVS